MNLHDFDEIRPLSPEELPAAFDSLLADEQFCAIMQSFFKDVPFEALKSRLYACKDNLEVQKAFFYPLVHGLIRRCSTGARMDADAIPAEARSSRFTFVSNHRDIVLDAALLDVMLIDNGFPTTVEIAIGDNLLIYPWIKTLVRVNKSFIVQRSVGIREMLASSKRMSEYMHFAISEKHENVWIAQREGRAKDSNDRTQESVLKMMAIGGKGSVQERLADLHIVPLAISYEYDPCDFLKAQELQQRRDNPAWKKGPMDDVISMQTGIMGYKGHIHYQCSPCIDGWLEQLDKDIPKTEIFSVIARHIDNQIYKGYRLYPGNYVALDLLNGNDAHAQHYTAKDKATFEAYIEAQLGKVTIPQPDPAFLRTMMLTMYANPAKNQLATLNA